MTPTDEQIQAVFEYNHKQSDSRIKQIMDRWPFIDDTNHTAVWLGLKQLEAQIVIELREKIKELKNEILD